MTINSLLDACEYVLTDQAAPQSSFWLAEQMKTMKIWQASEVDVREALNRDIAKNGTTSRFMKVADDEFALAELTQE